MVRPTVQEPIVVHCEATLGVRLSGIVVMDLIHLRVLLGSWPTKG
jgi:hypothetical protein